MPWGKYFCNRANVLQLFSKGSETFAPGQKYFAWPKINCFLCKYFAIFFAIMQIILPSTKSFANASGADCLELAPNTFVKHLQNICKTFAGHLANKLCHGWTFPKLGPLLDLTWMELLGAAPCPSPGAAGAKGPTLGPLEFPRIARQRPAHSLSPPGHGRPGADQRLTSRRGGMAPGKAFNFNRGGSRVRSESMLLLG